MRCPSCDLIIDSNTAWKNSTNRFYCSEFCADSEISAPIERCTGKEVLDESIWSDCGGFCPFFKS
jgi:hypothetical protein